MATNVEPDVLALHKEHPIRPQENTQTFESLNCLCRLAVTTLQLPACAIVAIDRCFFTVMAQAGSPLPPRSDLRCVAESVIRSNAPFSCPGNNTPGASAFHFYAAVPVPGLSDPHVAMIIGGTEPRPDGLGDRATVSLSDLAQLASSLLRGVDVRHEPPPTPSALPEPAPTLSLGCNRENRLVLIHQATADVLWTYHPDTQAVEWNESITRVLGYALEEVDPTSEWWQSHIHPDDRQRVLRHFDQAAKAGDCTATIEYRFQRKDGSWAHILDRACFERDPHGKVVLCVGAMQDVTSERRLRTKLSRFIEQSNDLVVEMTLQGRFTEASSQVLETIGYTPAELCRHHWREIAHPEDAPLLAAALNQIRHGAPFRAVIVRLRARNGRWVPLSWSGVLIPDEQRILCAARNITAEQHAEERLRESEERYRTLFNRSPLPAWVYDLTSLRILAVNEAAIQLYGYSRDEFLSMTLRDLRPPEEVQRLLEAVQSPSGMVRKEGVWKHRTNAGADLLVEVVSHEFSFGGRPARLELIRDVTEKLQLEERLRQAHKMEAIGQLAGGVAHDFNNILTVINGYAEVLNLRSIQAGQNSHEAQLILNAGQRAAALTRQLLAFSRKQMLQPRVLSLNSILTDLQPMLHRLIPENITVEMDLSPSLHDVKADPIQIEQVILNLAINARDSMPRGGRLSVTTLNVTLDAAYAAQHADVSPGTYVMLVLADTGHGIEPDLLNRIFEPFFTTKDKSQGTGLGLPMVYGIVKQSGGHVAVHSERGIGTTFKVFLPGLGGPAVQEENSLSNSPQSLDGSETVLVVEDDPGVREFTAAVLRDLGYTVLEAAGADQALTLSATHPGGLHLLITDVVLPGGTGRSVADSISSRFPGVRVLYVSGYAEAAIVHQGVVDPEINFLSKPFDRATLAAKVRSVLEVPPMVRSVLVVDDEPAIREFFRVVLSAAGYQVLEAADGDTAVRQLAAHPVDLMITDLVMPEKEGIETIQAVRRDYPSTKVMAVSGAAGGQYLKMAKLLGAQMVLNKPIAPGALLDAVKGLIG